MTPRSRALTTAEDMVSPAPMSGGLQLPETSVPEGLIPSGLREHLHISARKFPQAHVQPHKLKTI